MGGFSMKRRGFMTAAAGSGAFLATGWMPALAQTGSIAPANAADGFGFTPGGLIPPERIGVQLFTVRALMAEASLGLEDTLSVLADAGIAQIEIGGDFLGRTPAEFRKLVEDRGMRVASNHFGPRTMDGENPWYSEEGRAQCFATAKELGLDHCGTAHYYNVPLTVEGFTEFAANMNIWGEHARANGLKFFFHNHNGEFTRFDGKPIYDILLEQTDPELVAFEFDIGWAAAAGEDAAALVRTHQARFPYFHVKDLNWAEDGNRTGRIDTLAGEKKFDFADVGKGEIDWTAVFAGLDDPSQHLFFIEHDDAGRTVPEEGFPKAANPAGAANTIWTGRKHIAGLSA
ncbi:sugar phosphate isomerase/epimerase family protein [Falsirhodobacter xinxiangensis]|uniref:sugar phosphate isomerase/epimerase family protein n=1 Tax=Falsirhodobacter xinxiangensis TaxID=2530049 RepID=UPI0010AB2FE4|nr:sugar phosphate isomerase/epimerase [Rhodobacter xinxiangensis]